MSKGVFLGICGKNLSFVYGRELFNLLSLSRFSKVWILYCTYCSFVELQMESKLLLQKKVAYFVDSVKEWFLRIQSHPARSKSNNRRSLLRLQSTATIIFTREKYHFMMRKKHSFFTESTELEQTKQLPLDVRAIRTKILSIKPKKETTQNSLSPSKS